jgi:FkbM family methyltransferase
MNSTYTQGKFTRYITIPIKIIVECGSRDCLDAIEMLNYYKPDKIYSFECNPESISVCENNIKEFSKIELIKKAVTNKNGVVPFYPTDMIKCVDKNIGASSLLKHKDINFIQKEITVDGIRLDTFMNQYNVDKIDLLCMDLQGAEWLALDGLGWKKIKNVSYIILEAEDYYYNGAVPFRIINHKLSKRGFTFLLRSGGNAIFKNRNI